MTKIYLLSDLHNERLPFQIPADIEDYDVLVAAGDINDDPELAIEYLAGVGKPVVMVCGNHDLWSDVKRGRPNVDFSVRLGHLKRLCEGTQVTLLEQESVMIGDTRFLGTMYWTSYYNRNKQLMHYATSSINDFTSIGAQGWLKDPRIREEFLRDCKHYGFERDNEDSIDWETVRFHPVLAFRWHQEAQLWLGEELRKTGDWKHTVVVTHHAPTYLSLIRTGYIKEESLDPKTWSERLDIRWDNANIYRIGSYASPDDDLLARHHDKLDLWIHGHVHRSVNLSAGGVRVVGNPRGYAYHREDVQAGDNHDFNPRLVIDLDAQSGGYMDLLKAEIDESAAKLEAILDEIKGFGAHRNNKDPVLRVAAREAFNKRVEAFSEEGHKICNRVNKNVQKRGFLPNHNDLQFPLKAFCVSPELSTDKYTSKPRRRTDRALSNIVRDAKAFIAVLLRIPKLPVLMAKEARAKATLVLDAWKNEGVTAAYVPVDDQHADVELWLRVEGQHTQERKEQLSQIADVTINKHMSREWFVNIKWEQPADDEEQTEEAGEAAAGARTSVEATPVAPTEEMVSFPGSLYVNGADVFYAFDHKWKTVTVRMERTDSTSPLFSHAHLAKLVEHIKATHGIQIERQDTGERIGFGSDDRDTRYRMVFVMGDAKYRANVIRRLPREEGGVGDVVVELEPS